MTALEHNVEAAVASAEDLRWMKGYLRGLLDSGLTQSELEVVLRNVYEVLRTRGDDDEADLVLDGLDLLTGWCGPGMALTA